MVTRVESKEEERCSVNTSNNRIVVRKNPSEAKMLTNAPGLLHNPLEIVVKQETAMVVALKPVVKVDLI